MCAIGFVWLFITSSACGRSSETDVSPALVTLELAELRLAHPAGWTLAPTAPRPALLATRFEQARTGNNMAVARYHVLRPSGGGIRLPGISGVPGATDVDVEIGIRPRPRHGMLAVALELERQAASDAGYAPAEIEVVNIRGRTWLRSESQAPGRPAGGAAEVSAERSAEIWPKALPKVSIEYATAHGATLYTVTVRGPTDAARGLADALAPSLAIAAEDAGTADFLSAPQISATAAAAARDPAAAAAVMVIAADVDGDRLIAMAGGSGVVVSADGAVLTSLHVLEAQPPAEAAQDGQRSGLAPSDDQRSEPGPLPGGDTDPGKRRLHDLFVIGRVVPGRSMPALICAGRPVHGALARNLDLAVIRCDRALDGQPWRMQASWQALATGSTAGLGPSAALDPEPGPGAGTGLGDDIRVLGFPDSAGGALTSITGQVVGWSQNHGQEPYLEIRAAITPGLSGGAVVSRDGLLLGVVTAFRLRTEAHARAGTLALDPIERIGLVRPIEQAMPLLIQSGQIDAR